MTRMVPKLKLKSEAGFTLVEVLVSLVISASVMAGLTTLAGSVNHSLGSVAGKLSSQEMLGNGLTIAAGDISRIERIADHRLVPPVFRFHGERSTMDFIISERPSSATRGLYWVHLYTRKTTSGMALVRARAPFDGASSVTGEIQWADEVVLAEGQYSYDFSYREGRRELETWQREWPPGNSLPGLVRIQLDHLDTGAEAYPPYVIALKVGAEAACSELERTQCTMKTAGNLLSESR